MFGIVERFSRSGEKPPPGGAERVRFDRFGRGTEGAIE